MGGPVGLLPREDPWVAPIGALEAGAEVEGLKKCCDAGEGEDEGETPKACLGVGVCE